MEVGILGPRLVGKVPKSSGKFLILLLRHRDHEIDRGGLRKWKLQPTRIYAFWGHALFFSPFIVVRPTQIFGI